MFKTLSQGGVIWFTGLAGSGKSYIAQALYERLRQNLSNVIHLDGDEFRELLGHFGYEKDERIKVSLKKAQFAHFLSSQGMIVIVSAISMFEQCYNSNRKNLKNFFEIYVQCDFEELLRRDKKGLYSGALNAKIQNVVGVDIKYDEPKPDLTINNTHFGALDEKLTLILEALKLKDMNQTMHG